MTRTFVLVLAVLVAAQTAPSMQAPAAQAALDYPPSTFADPDRRAKLASAFEAIDRRIDAFMKERHVPGAAWGIVIDGELAHAGTAGFRNLEAKAPVTPDSVFRIASMTKSFTAMAVMKLRDEGRISLDEPAERYVPELKGLRYPTSDSRRITVRDLLSQQTGFPEDNPWGDQQLAATEEEFTRMLEGGIPFSNTSGIAYEYSNYGFAILGRLITNVSGVPYRDYIASAILQPLGMTSTMLEPSAAGDNLVLGYRWEDEQWKLEPALPDGAFGSMGGMLTSMADLAKYVGAFLDAFPARDGAETSPVRRATLREMQQVWRARPAVVTAADGKIDLNAGGYAYGLRVGQSCAFDHIVAHTGGLPGYGSIMQWLPEHGVGFIAFGNVTYTGWTPIAGEVFDMLAATGALEPRTHQPSPWLTEARESVSRLILNWDDAEADRMAAMNLYLDRAKERRRDEIQALRADVGACTAPDSFDYVENWLRGQWTMACERGNLRVAITLAPTMPPRVQHLDVRKVSAGAAAPLPACRVQ